VKPRSETNATKRIACLGDSITYGARSKNPKTDSYPAQLAEMLGDGYEVRNFGIGGATLLKKGRPCTWQIVAEAVHFRPDIVIIMLGTNDTVSGNWKYIEDFSKDANELISAFLRLPTKPKILFCSPTDMILETEGLTQERIDNLKERRPRLHKLIPVIKRIARENAVEYLNMNSVFQGKSHLLTDGVHPNIDGYRLLAEKFHKDIMLNDGANLRN
jgi:acyl-CoA thioesterase-1